MSQITISPNSPAARIRPRRLRVNPAMRDLVAEVRLHPRQLMQPYFVLEGESKAQPIAAMPGVDRLSIDRLLAAVSQSFAQGLRQVLLFGVPPRAHKDSQASHAGDPEGLVPRAVRALKQQFGADLLVATDVCLCAYTDHGHCGVLRAGHVDNDASLAPLAQMAVAHAQAGADIVAPSDMMDHRIGYLRDALDSGGCQQTALMSYSVKYASAYYGPFREAADSAPGQGDRRSYQMDPRNLREAHKVLELDIAQGADMVMVKPALAYLDVLAAMRPRTHLPLACYNVSGEYSMVKAAAAQGWIDEAAVVRENLIAMRRAGADLIITYHAQDALAQGWLAP